MYTQLFFFLNGVCFMRKIIVILYFFLVVKYYYGSYFLIYIYILYTYTRAATYNTHIHTTTPNATKYNNIFSSPPSQKILFVLLLFGRAKSAQRDYAYTSVPRLPYFSHAKIHARMVRGSHSISFNDLIYNIIIL